MRAAAPRVGDPTRFRPYLGRGAGQVPPGEILPRGLAERPPGEVERLGHVGGVDRGHDDDPDVVAAAADLAVYVQGGRGAFLLGELAGELAADGSPRAPAAGAGHAEPHQVAHVSQAVIPDRDRCWVTHLRR
jgi:hypothetical protein